MIPISPSICSPFRSPIFVNIPGLDWNEIHMSLRFTIVRFVLNGMREIYCSLTGPYKYIHKIKSDYRMKGQSF